MAAPGRSTASSSHDPNALTAGRRVARAGEHAGEVDAGDLTGVEHRHVDEVLVGVAVQGEGGAGGDADEAEAEVGGGGAAWEVDQVDVGVARWRGARGWRAARGPGRRRRR